MSPSSVLDIFSASHFFNTVYMDASMALATAAPLPTVHFSTAAMIRPMNRAAPVDPAAATVDISHYYFHFSLFKKINPHLKIIQRRLRFRLCL